MNRHYRPLAMILVPVILASLGYMGCGEMSTEPGQGTLIVHMQFNGAFSSLSDAPLASDDKTTLHALGNHGDLIPQGRTPLVDLIITLTRVDVWSCAEGSSEEVVSASSALIENDEDCEPHEVLADTPLTVSVAGLDCALTALLGTAELPEGDYSHTLLGISKALVVTQAGDTVEANLPGGSNTLKVNSPFTVSEGSVDDVVIVFDVHRSIVETPPGSQNFKVKPVLHHNQGWAKEIFRNDACTVMLAEGKLSLYHTSVQIRSSVRVLLGMNDPVPGGHIDRNIFEEPLYTESTPLEPRFATSESEPNFVHIVRLLTNGEEDVVWLRVANEQNCCGGGRGMSESRTFNLASTDFKGTTIVRIDMEITRLRFITPGLAEGTDISVDAKVQIWGRPATTPLIRD